MYEGRCDQNLPCVSGGPAVVTRGVVVRQKSDNDVEGGLSRDLLLPTNDAPRPWRMQHHTAGMRQQASASFHPRFKRAETTPRTPKTPPATAS